MQRILIFLMLSILGVNCTSQTDYSKHEKIKFNDDLFFAKVAKGYVALTAADEPLFPVPYDNISAIGNPTFKFFLVENKSKFGLIDFDGIEVIHPEYDAIVDLENKTSGETYLKMKYQDKWGILSFPGNILIEPFVYDEIGTFGESKRLLLVKKEGKYGYQDLKISGRNSTHIEYDFLEDFKNDGAPYIKGDQKGFLHFVEPYGDLVEFPEGENYQPLPEVKVSPYSIKRFQSEDKKWGVKNKNDNQVLVQPIYSKLIKRLTHDGVIYLAIKDGKAGIINAKNEVILPFKYSDISDGRSSKKIGVGFFNDEYSVIFKVKNGQGKTGLIDLQDNVLIPLIYDDIRHSAGTYYMVKKGEKWGIFDTKSQQFTLDIEWESFRSIGVFGNRGLLLKKDNREGLADWTGKIMIAPTFYQLGHSSKSYTFAGRNTLDSMIYHVSDYGDVLSPKSEIGISIISPSTFAKRILVTNKEGKQEIAEVQIDLDGNPKYPNIDGNVYHAYAQMSIFRKDGKAGVFNRDTEDIILKNEYEAIDFLPPFTNRVKVRIGKKWGIIDLEGNEILPVQYDRISIFNDVVSSSTFQFAAKRFLYKITENGKTGIIDYKGEVWVEPKFPDKFLTFMVDDFRDYIVVFNENGKHGLYKYKHFVEPNEYFDNIFTKGKQLIVVKDGQERKATITGGNRVKYE